MKSETKMIIGAVACVAFGTLIVGLFGTDEGRKTRKKVAKKSRKLRNKMKQQIGELKVSAGRQYENVKQTANELIDEGKEKVAAIAGNAK